MANQDKNDNESDSAFEHRVRDVSSHVLSDQWARLEQVQFDYRRRDGQWQTQQREVYHRGHGAGILLYNLELRTIVLTRQFRYPAFSQGNNGFLLEVPAGIVENNNPAATIRSETQQETGFLIDEPRFLFKAFVSPGSVTEQLYYYSAEYQRDLRDGDGGGLADEGEDIEVLEVKLETAVEWIAEGRIVDAKTIILVQYAQLSVFC